MKTFRRLKELISGTDRAVISSDSATILRLGMTGKVERERTTNTQLLPIMETLLIGTNSELEGRSTYSFIDN